MINEMPSITGSSYASNCVNTSDFFAAQAIGVNAMASNGIAEYQDAVRTFKGAGEHRPQAFNQFSKEQAPMATRRLVQVFIADPNNNIPLEQSLIYSGEQKLTDATDQELFFEIDIKGILEKHNEKRIKIIDKKVKERTEYLEPAKIRDLKMVVVNVASF